MRVPEPRPASPGAEPGLDSAGGGGTVTCLQDAVPDPAPVLAAQSKDRAGWKARCQAQGADTGGHRFSMGSKAPGQFTQGRNSGKATPNTITFCSNT